MRFGVFLTGSFLIAYVIAYAVFGCMKKDNTTSISSIILSGFSALLSPCIIVQQGSGMILNSSIISAATYSLLVGSVITMLNVNSYMWNPSLSKNHIGTKLGKLF